MHKIPVLLFLLIILHACTPKQFYVKKEFNGKKPVIEKVFIAVEFASLKDDVGKLWDFDEEYNLNYQDKIYQGAKTALEAKGYHVLPSYLKTSGLMIDRNYEAEHYKNKKLQEKLISPPFIIRSTDLTDTDIDVLIDIHYELYNTISPSIAAKTHDYQHNSHQSKKILSPLTLADNTAILIVSANKPRVSAIKNIGIGLLSAGLVAGATSGAYIGVTTLHGIPTTNSYLIHKGSGELLWSNFSGAVNISPKTTSFFSTIPEAEGFK